MPDQRKFGRARTTTAALALFLAALPGIAAAGFYDVTPTDLAGPPGKLIRVEPMHIYPAGSKGYRILYTSTGLEGQPIAVSGIAAIPEKAGSDRPVVAWGHATTGIARKCAPSLQAESLTPAWIPGIDLMIKEGYVVVGTDYPGLGTEGMHPYLVGVSEGRAMLDAVRAMRHLPDARAGTAFGVWGHSQGGHAALFAGELAKTYAPELTLVGVAAAAPATELSKLFDDHMGTKIGALMSSLTLDSWSSIYDIALDTVVDKSAIGHVKRIGEECITGGPFQIAADLMAVIDIEKRFLFASPVTTSPWDHVIAINRPGQAHPGAPVFLAQGSRDEVVEPQLTTNFADKLCKHGAAVRFFAVPDATHEMIGNASAPAAMAWMASRFAGAPPENDCRGR